MRRYCSQLIVVASLVLIACSFTRSGQIGGDLEILDLESRVFGNSRKLRVWLPPDYNSDLDRQYPVLYLNDGQDVFSADTSIYFTDEWSVDETLYAMIRDKSVEPIIVVGIDNAGRTDRAREYLPYPDEFLDPPVSEPIGDQYGSFLETEVIPLVESNYRTLADKSGRALGGSSYGGLIALYVAVSHSHLFNKLLLESPSFYVDDNHVLRDVAQAELELELVYLGVGTNEIGLDDCEKHPTNDLAVEGVLDLSRILATQHMGSDQIHINIEECATHSPSAWARRLPNAMRFLYGSESSQPAPP